MSALARLRHLSGFYTDEGGGTDKTDKTGSVSFVSPGWVTSPESKACPEAPCAACDGHQFTHPPGRGWVCISCAAVTFASAVQQADWQFCTLAGAQSYLPMTYPPDWVGWPDESPGFSLSDPMTAPPGKCSGCRFNAPLSPRRLCGRCETERLFTAAERVLAGMIATSDEGELLRVGDEP